MKKIIFTRGSHLVSYIDAITSWWPPEAIAAGIGVPGYAKDTSYNVINFAFWLTTGPADVAQLWANPVNYFGPDSVFGKTNSEIQINLANKFHSKNIKILVSAFGDSNSPTSTSPETTCNRLATFVKDNHLDGVDLDYEDNAAFEHGIAEDWLIRCTKAIRAVLPSGQYLLTHAPQGPYFMGTSKYPNNGYLKIHQEVGNLIDWYNVQFYNQASTAYTSYECLFTKSDGWSTGTSVKEMESKGIPSSKIVVGKPASPGAASNTGYVDPDVLAGFISRAKGEIGWSTGVMLWEYKWDNDGHYINKIHGVLP